MGEREKKNENKKMKWKEIKSRKKGWSKGEQCLLPVVVSQLVVKNMGIRDEWERNKKKRKEKKMEGWVVVKKDGKWVWVEKIIVKIWGQQ